MKTIDNNNKREAGQVIPLIVLMMFVIIGMVALILDGGAVMSNRRTAQAAADAGALAGAQCICTGECDAQFEAETYAINNVPEGNLPPSVTISGKEVTVVTTVEHPSFFAKIFGEQNLKATAEAIAGCYYPSVADRVLPIAFYYESPPVNVGDADCKEDGSCTLVAYDFDELMAELRDTEVVDNTTNEINLPLDDIYVISDKTKICEKYVTGEIVCSEMAGLESGGNRSFLDLNDVLKDIIKDGLDTPLHLPAWVNGEAGAVSSVYKAKNFITNYPPIVGYESLKARLYFVPVFDLFCEDCYCEPTEDFDSEYCDQLKKPSYHLLGFGPFIVTCVQMGPKCEYGECVPADTWKLGGEEITVKKDRCPGLLAADPSQANANAIEGYFVEKFPADQYIWGTEGVDVGVWLISLSK